MIAPISRLSSKRLISLLYLQRHRPSNFYPTSSFLSPSSSSPTSLLLSSSSSSSNNHTRNLSILTGIRAPAIIAKCATFAVGFMAVSLGFLYKYQDKMLYIPEMQGLPRSTKLNPPNYRSPAEYDIPFEERMIVTDDGVSIHSWLLLHPDSLDQKRPTIIFFHGNAGNMGYRLPNASEMYHHLQSNIFMVEYRGYGESSNTESPNEQGLKRDAEASLRFIRDHEAIDSTRLFLFGRSLGGAVAFHLARFVEDEETEEGYDDRRSPPRLAGVIVENTFVSVSRMVDVLLPRLSLLKPYLLTIGWDSGSVVGTLKVPVLYISGDGDELVPPEHMRELYEMSRKSSVYARLHVVTNGTHDDTWMRNTKVYMKEINDFMEKSLAIIETSQNVDDKSSADRLHSSKDVNKNTIDIRIMSSDDTSDDEAKKEP